MAIASFARGTRVATSLLTEFDAIVESGLAKGTRTLILRGPAPGLAATALEVLTRYQRYVGRVNAHSGAPAFARILALHRGLHDLDEPRVRADYEHALDTWQWLLRLEPRAASRCSSPRSSTTSSAWGNASFVAEGDREDRHEHLRARLGGEQGRKPRELTPVATRVKPKSHRRRYT